MYDTDDIDLATEFHNKATAVLNELKLALTPINYAVIYVHISRRNAELTKTIVESRSQGIALDDEYLQELFNVFLLKNEAFKKELVAPFDSMIDKVLLQISAQADADSKIVKELELVDAQLTDDGSDIPGLITNLVGITQKAKEVHVSLSEELEKATNEINALKEKLQESEKEAITDTLTGLLNRRGFNQHKETIENPKGSVCLVIDIDHFKKINDTYGHLIGDRVIKRVANETKDNVRGRDIVVRFGGEEFMVVLVDTPLEGAKKVAETIRTRISQLKLVQRSANITLPPITVSIGVAANDKASDWNTLFKRADEALYAAKEAGRNQTKVSDMF